MAQVYPKLTPQQRATPGHHGEMLFHDACENHLPENYKVIYSLRWIVQLGPAPRDGETDFIIFVPNRGFLAVEVKGGSIGFDEARNAWFTVDHATGRRKDLERSPFGQAEDEKRATVKLLEKNARWATLGDNRIIVGHAVFVPALARSQAAKLVGPDSPREILGCGDDLTSLQDWVEQVMTYWQGRLPARKDLDRRWMDIVQEELIRKSFEVRPLMVRRLAVAEEQRDRFTLTQARALRLLGDRKEAAIYGGAGTGKTMLALHRAEVLAEEGKQVLLLCHTRPLADFLKHRVGQRDKLKAMSFCQFCEWSASIHTTRTHEDPIKEAESAFPGENYYRVQLPAALTLVAEGKHPDLRYDAILVDEGQDFPDEYWDALPPFLKDVRESFLYVFYDQNQRVFGRTAAFPIKNSQDHFPLSENCRSTKSIHDLSYKYFTGKIPDHSKIDDMPIRSIECDGITEQAAAISEEICRLIQEEQVDASQITVLVAGLHPEMMLKILQQANGLPAPFGWSKQEHWQPRKVLIETVRRYEGLECDVIFLWGLDDLSHSEDCRTLYVGLSRAKTLLYLVGSHKTCKRILNPRFDAQPSHPPPPGDWDPV